MDKYLQDSYYFLFLFSIRKYLVKGHPKNHLCVEKLVKIGGESEWGEPYGDNNV